MREITTENAAEYLRANGRIATGERVNVTELAGGVSNMVLLVELPTSGQRTVLKQARGRLRVTEEWLCPVERIWREVEVLRTCGKLLETPCAQRRPRNEEVLKMVPTVLWEDRQNFLFAMSAAPAKHRTWK